MDANDPSSSYDVGDVTVKVAGVPISKGGARGAFVYVGPRHGPAFHVVEGSGGVVARSRNIGARRSMTITLLRASKGNGVLNTRMQDRTPGVSVVVERERGGTVLEANLVMFGDGSPRDAGRDERVSTLEVVG